MATRHPIAIAIAVAVGAAACGSGSDSLTDDAEPGAGGSSSSGGASSSDNAIKNLKDKEYFKSNVFPFLSQKCGSCHDAAGPGPAWITASDGDKTYSQLFQVGYVMEQSRIVQQTAHAGATTNFLAPEEAATYEKWVQMELADSGPSSTSAVLERLGPCFDRSKFEEMDLGNWRTMRRTTENNTYKVENWNENANNCTGCNAAKCSTCHSADAATNFKNSVGNPVLPVSSTFEESKLLKPAYITKYFGVSPDGKPVPSGAIKRKSEATQRDRAYSHPMFVLTPEIFAAIDAFVNDTIARYNAGTCGK